MPPYIICDLPLYHSFSTTTMSKSLNSSLLVTLKKGNTKFKCSNPLQSFTLMTSKLPTPHSVCIRSVHCLYGSLCSRTIMYSYRYHSYAHPTVAVLVYRQSLVHSGMNPIWTYTVPLNLLHLFDLGY